MSCMQSRYFSVAQSLLKNSTLSLCLKRGNQQLLTFLKRPIITRSYSLLNSCMMSRLSPEEVESSIANRDPATKDYIFQQTMLRVKDPKKSLKFYSNVLGMRCLHQLHFESMKFSLYFMGYESEDEFPKTDEERLAWCFSRKATLELTHNWGSESDDTQYHNGNADPKGFGHIGIAVPDLNAACDRFEKMGVQFKKRPSDGKMNGIAFIMDPDNYWIEIFNPKKVLDGFVDK